VYVTVNTLLHDNELAEAEKLTNQLYEAGADALIIQDAGLLELELPPLPLFASTQMHNHTPERVAFLEKVGFQRAILARELTLEQIREIRAKTTIELETFIHGALCVSYSGQCYLSYAIGGRSGNRGQCAQPCRRPYALVGRDGQKVVANRYLLSLHDLNLSASLAELVDAGVCSFKIEGRLKDKDYVMNVVGHYRRQLDEVLNARGLRAAASGKVHLDFEPDPNKTFNRGYSSYFLHGRSPDIAAPDSPKSLGEPLGEVVSVGKYSFLLEATAPALHPADGLCFYDEQKELIGTIVNKVDGRANYPASLAGLKPGVLVYRNHDQSFSEQLRKSRAARKIQLSFTLEPAPGGLRLAGVDEDGNRADFSQELALEPAQQVEKARDTILRQLHKLGETDFECTHASIALDPLPFIPVAALNALRRGAVDLLILERERNRSHPEGGAVVNRAPFPEKRLAFTGNVLNGMAEQFYRRHGVETIEPAAESGLDLTGRVVMTTKHCLRYQLNACPRQTNPVKLPEPLKLIDEQGIEYPLRFDCKACVMEVLYRKQG
jgi:23S rRNA 5-hydroxycytidine C2501 synthase